MNYTLVMVGPYDTAAEAWDAAERIEAKACERGDMSGVRHYSVKREQY